MLRRRPAPRPVLPAHRWSGESRLRRFWNALRWWLGAALVLVVMWYYVGQQRIAPDIIPAGPNEVLTGPFTRCGRGRAITCVVDGDTIMVGSRAVRVIGIDAPEIHPPRCADEAQKGEAAAQGLLALLNQGPVTLAGPAPPVHDEYGRELRHLLRAKADGSIQSLADDMVSSGLARPYLRGARDPWC